MENKSATIAKANSRDLEPELMSKLKALRSMPRGAKRAQAWKSLKQDALVWGNLILASCDDPRFVAKLASQDLKGFSEIITRAVEKGDKQFFIDLGKYLSGELKAELWDQLDIDILRMVLAKPSIIAKHAVRELQKLGWRLTEEAFRMRKKRLGLDWAVGKRAAFSRHGRSREV